MPQSHKARPKGSRLHNSRDFLISYWPHARLVLLLSRRCSGGRICWLDISLWLHRKIQWEQCQGHSWSPIYWQKTPLLKSLSGMLIQVIGQENYIWHWCNATCINSVRKTFTRSSNQPKYYLVFIKNSHLRMANPAAAFTRKGPKMRIIRSRERYACWSSTRKKRVKKEDPRRSWPFNRKEKYHIYDKT